MSAYYTNYCQAVCIIIHAFSRGRDINSCVANNTTCYLREHTTPLKYHKGKLSREAIFKVLTTKGDIMKILNLKTLLYLLFLMVLFIGLPGEITSQKDTTSIWNIIAMDGNEYHGTIISRNKEVIQLKTEALGIITLQVSEIQKMTLVDPENLINGEVWLDNPQESRYFWSPSSYGLKKGEGYYQNVWILFNQFAVGITDNISIGAGIMPLFLFGGSATPVWITPKFSIPVVKDKFNLGGGALLGTVIGGGGSGDGGSNSFGVAYGTSTFGSRDQNVTIGVGYGFMNGDWASSPTVTFSGMFRTGKRGYFITENYYLGSSELMLLSLGGRVVWQNVSLDYGGIIPFGSDVGSFVIIPWLGFVIPFGN